MSLRKLQQYWDGFGATDPMWAVLMEPEKKGNRWGKDEFFATGVSEIADLLKDLSALNLSFGRKSALDFGCGVGRLSQALAAQFEQVHGIDIAPSMVAEAEKYNQFPHTCHYHVNDTDDLSAFESGTFDLVYSCRVLQHIEPQYSRRYIEEFCRIVAKDGALVFQIPDRPTPAITLRLGLKSLIPAALLRMIGKPRGGPETLMHCISKAEVTSIVTSAGLRIIDTRPDNSAPGWTCYRYTAVKG